jgi:hypothetical protein
MIGQDLLILLIDKSMPLFQTMWYGSLMMRIPSLASLISMFSL